MTALFTCKFLASPSQPDAIALGLLERLDLSEFYAQVRSYVDGPGRPASDPQVLLGLWVYGTAQGISSGRQLAPLSETDDRYRWLRGGVPVDYHMLDDFRVAKQEALDQLMTEILALLMDQGLVRLEGVAHDGVRLRANAGAASFRRRRRLEEHLEQAQQQVKQLAQEREEGAEQGRARQRAAQERAASDRERRLEEALREIPLVEAVKARQRKKQGRARRERVGEARVSETDAQARVMKMADGGFRPAMNAQLATDMESQVMVGVAVTNRGTDECLAAPMEEQVAQRTGRHPGKYVVDGGFASLADIVTLSQRQVTLYSPSRPPTGDKRRQDPTLPRLGDPPEVAAWRRRMATPEAQATYRQRGATAECVNAQVEGRYGLRQLPVRGLDKALSVLLLVAITHNLLRWIALTA